METNEFLDLTVELSETPIGSVTKPQLESVMVEFKLNSLEKEIIEQILNGEIKGTKRSEMDYPTVAYMIWLSNENRIEFGRVRGGYRGNIHTSDGVFDSLSASPFPGAWTMVPVYRIIRISHVEAF